MHIREFIEKNYPQYYSIEEYPAGKVAPIRKAAGEWGILGNFGHAAVTVNGVCFNNTEKLFQVMKFIDPVARAAIYSPAKGTPKMIARKYEGICGAREDWGRIIVDVMKFCLMTKYGQSDEFRTVLEQSKGLYIVEDQTSFPKKQADTWGAKLIGDKYVGPNLLGRLLMELRDNGRLDYKMPEGILVFDDLIQ